MLPSLVSKIPEAYVADKLDDFLEKFNLVDPNQFGYQRNKGTTDLLEIVTEKIYQCLNDRPHIVVSFVDFSKAFDILNHGKILSTLENIGVRGNLKRKSYLEDRKFNLKVKDFISRDTNVTRGVPQGSILGPKLFVLYVNDISACFDKCILCLLMTLLLLYIHRVLKVATVNLQKEFVNFQKWAHDKELTTNNKKTVLMHITSPQSGKSVPVLIKIKKHENQCLHSLINSEAECHCEHFMEQVSSFKYLGVIIDEHFSWQHHIDSLSKKLFFCTMTLWKLKYFFPTDTLLLIYRSLIESLMRYCLTSWVLASKVHISRIQNIQDRCVRIIASKNIENLNLEELYAKFKILKIQTLLGYKYILKFHNNPKFQKTDTHCYNTRLEKTGYLNPPPNV